MARKMKLAFLLPFFVLGTPPVVMASISLALSGLDYGIIYPIGVISSSLATLVLFWVTALPEMTLYFVKQKSPRGGQTQEYRGFGRVLIAVLFFAIASALFGFVQEGVAHRDAKLSVHLVVCVSNFVAGLWFLWRCTFKSEWVARILYSKTSMTCRHGASVYELEELRYIHNGRNDWMPVFRIGALWRAIGQKEEHSLKTFECKVSRSVFPKMDVDHFVATMTPCSQRVLRVG